MDKFHFGLKKSIISVLDFFYPPFRKIIPIQTYYYIVCGGVNNLIGMVLYPVFYFFIFEKSKFILGQISISPHIAALLAVSSITLPIGFYLSLFVVFPGSSINRNIQFVRYLLIAVLCIMLNYLLLKFFVDFLNWNPTFSFYLNILIVVVFSFYLQKYFAFAK